MISIPVKVTPTGGRYIVCPTCRLPRGPVSEGALSYTCRSCDTECALTHDIVLSNDQHFSSPPLDAA